MEAISMAKKPGKKPRGKPKRKMTAKEQSAQFIKTARELGVDESGTRFDEVVRKILKTKYTAKS
jgi:hypothetical protein